MLRKIIPAILLLAAMLIFTGETNGQRVHVGLYFSSPHLSIVTGEPVFWPYYYPYPYPVHYRHHYRYGSYGYYYPHRYYYGYRHDRGWHKGWNKHRHR